ncbi:BZ3500_MvSof-1268-A1-R1_Chr11-2g03386 [Microbotryum saponariae]|uniref:BZ3500_MvSof-1268-A1-R1_Chr11-2g03386 protein n=1 Tax=Microbotryum saponariae TaxID=289078 RepID=A0A2X0MTA4_9BASI|nr:BZ3500_MvSof-1268-A1-R1_Chr11-2g03386 [Microbotryum saponariae]SDA03257.1 BZ3501_MvSof-1269-A2-R1_Chr11g02957 [Microbotryum saponariae]
MTENALASLKTNAQRLGARLGENLAASDGFASGSGGGSGRYLENGAVITSAGIEETKKMLASKRESDRVDGLKRVIAMMTKKLPVLGFFPLVTSLLSPSTPLQARTLISLYIIHCANSAPELALLSINAYQKDLSDPNPIVRAGAIKTLSSMNLPDIRSLVGVAVSKGARDGAWYVRRATADAVATLWRADPTTENRNQLLPTLIVLLNSASPLTIGSVLSAWEEMCPTRWDLVHPCYRKWCRMLVDVEEWGQTVVLRVLLQYGRSFFLDPARIGKLDPDAELLLKASDALLQHINPSVVSATIKVHYYLAPSDRLPKIVRPLLRLLRSSPEVKAIVLEDCAVVASTRPELLAEHVSEFYVRSSEVLSLKQARLRILVALTNQTNVREIMKELSIYVKDGDEMFSADAIKAIGSCAQQVPAVSEECLQTLIELTQSKHEVIIAQSVLVLRSLLRSPHLPSSTSRPAVITRLVDLLEADRIKTPTARATIYWLVGQFVSDGLVSTVAPDVIRLGAIGFAEESEIAKLQLLTLSAKCVVASTMTSSTPYLREYSLLFEYLATLARYDLTYEVRDRARFLKGVLGAAGLERADAGKARVGLGEEDFNKGVMVEDFTGTSGDANTESESDKARTMSNEQARKILFEGKTFDVERGGSLVLTWLSTRSLLSRRFLSTRIDANAGDGPFDLGSFSLALPTKRLGFGSSSPSGVPSYPTKVPPSSIRDPPPSLDPTPPGSRGQSRSPTPLRGFGSDSLKNSAHEGAAVVLTPTNFARSANGVEGATRSGSVSGMLGGAGMQARRKGFAVLEDFYKDESGSEEESDVDDDDDAEEDTEDDDEEDEKGDEDDEDDGEDVEGSDEEEVAISDEKGESIGSTEREVIP